MRKFDLSLRSSRSSYFATFRHQLTILSKTDALDEERSEERFSRNAETEVVCSLLLEKKNSRPTKPAIRRPAVTSFQSICQSPRKLCATSDQASADVRRCRRPICCSVF